MRPQLFPRCFWLSALLLLTALPGWGQVSVLTQHNDAGRSGANLSETVLTPSNVNPSSFGKLFSVPADGHVYAQVLYSAGLAIGGGKHNVIFVATEHNSVYAYDADTGSLYWQVNLGPSVPSSDINTPNMPVEIGITSTPVIDPAGQTLYCVAATKENGKYLYRLHALELATGQEKLGGPTLIQASVHGTGDASVNGVVTLDPFKHNNRPALLLLNGTIYMAFASHEDYNPYHGWVLAYSAATLQQTAVFNVTPNGSEGGIWQAGQGLTADGSGNVYLITGNGTTSAPSGGADYGEAFLKMSLSGSTLAVSDWFIPNNYDALNAGDTDLGASGVLGIPGTNLIVGGGKEGKLYLINTANMGHYNAGADPVLQEFQAVHSRGSSGHLHGAPVYWNGPSGPHIYLWGENDFARAYPFYPASGNAPAYFGTTASSVGPDYSPALTSVYGMPGGFLSLSANGAQNGIIWATTPYDGDSIHAVVNGIFRAYDATNLSKELWNSKQVPSRDDLGLFAKYNPPTIANGKVYLPTFSCQVCVYGLLPAPGVPSQLSSLPGNNSIVLNWTAAAYAASYKVYRGTAAGGEAAAPVATGVNGTTYTDTGLTNGSRYFYRLVAVNAAGQSSPSAETSAVPAATTGSILSLRFNGGGGNGSPASMAAAESAGIVPAADWNNAAGSSGTIASLLDNKSGSTGATASWQSGAIYSLPITESAGNARMMKGYLDALGSSTSTVTISKLPAGITAAGYDVYVYADGDNGGASRAASYALGSAAQGLTDAANTNFSGSFLQAAAGGSGNCLKFSNLTAAGFTLTATPGTASDGNPRAPLNGIEIVAHSALVTVKSVSTGLAYTTVPLAAGVPLYTDRAFTVSSFGAALTGGTLVQTANSDKSVTAGSHLTLALAAAATVYIAYDKRETALPAWLAAGSGWTLTSVAFSGSDAGAAPMKVYSKSFSAGSLTLGGNLQAPAAGAQSSYAVIVKAN